MWYIFFAVRVAFCLLCLVDSCRLLIHSIETISVCAYFIATKRETSTIAPKHTSKTKNGFFFTRTHYFVCAVERLYVATKYSMKSFHWNDCARWLTQRRLHNYNEQECITRRYMLKPHWICLNYSVKHDRNALQSNCARYFFIISISPSSAGFTKSITFVIQFNDNNREILFKINRRAQNTRLKRIYTIFRRGIQIHLFPSRSLIYKSDNNIWNYNRELHASKPWRCWHCAIWISQYGIEIRKNHFC